MKNFSLLLIVFLLLQLSSIAQTKWNKYTGNPVLDVASPGEWDSWRVGHPDVYFDGTTYKMWYTGTMPTGPPYGLVGLATSTDGINWDKDTSNPILTGDSGAWDSEQVGLPVVIFNDNTYKMWYGGLDANFNFRIGYATSPDGITWEKHVGNPVINIGSTGSWEEIGVVPSSVIFDGAIYKMWYDGFDVNFDSRIGYATSLDGITWIKDTLHNPVLPLGPPGSWDDIAVGNADVLFDGTWYHMRYSGDNGASFRIGYATSSDGINWDKDSSNPVLNPGLPGSCDDFGVGHPRVISDGTIYQMWFLCADVSGYGRIGYAEDFSNLVHADSVIINEPYVEPYTDPANILGCVISPEGHAVTAKAMILSDDGSAQDSVELFDDGLHGDGDPDDGIYGGFLPVSDENFYTVGIKTIDQVTGFTRNGLNWNITNRFTTAGPIVIDSLEITYNPIPKTYKVRLFVRNGGQSFTVENLSAVVFPTGSFTVRVDSNFSTPFRFNFEIKSDGWLFWKDSISIVTSVEDEQTLPISYKLFQNYPNPFNPTTTIKYQIPELSFAAIKVFDILGKEVVTLVNEEKPAGYYEVEFNATSLASGIYFYQLQAGSLVETKKMVLIK
jgi:predicted GH43/DUF377 family glycosyl hydrolase